MNCNWEEARTGSRGRLLRIWLCRVCRVLFRFCSELSTQASYGTITRSVMIGGFAREPNITATAAPPPMMTSRNRNDQPCGRAGLDTCRRGRAPMAGTQTPDAVCERRISFWRRSPADTLFTRRPAGGPALPFSGDRRGRVRARMRPAARHSRRRHQLFSYLQQCTATTLMVSGRSFGV